MKSTLSIFFTLFTLTCLLFSAGAASVEIKTYSEQASLNFSLSDLKGKTHTLADYKGKVVLVNFWASWCPPCIYEMPELQKLKKHFVNRPFEVLTINVAEKKYKVRKFTNIIKLNLPVLLDTSSKTYNDWRVNILPTSFLIGSDGKVRYQIRGNPGWQNEESITIIENMLP